MREDIALGFAGVPIFPELFVGFFEADFFAAVFLERDGARGAVEALPFILRREFFAVELGAFCDFRTLPAVTRFPVAFLVVFFLEDGPRNFLALLAFFLPPPVAVVFFDAPDLERAFLPFARLLKLGLGVFFLRDGAERFAGLAGAFFALLAGFLRPLAVRLAPTLPAFLEPVFAALHSNLSASNGHVG